MGVIHILEGTSKTCDEWINELYVTKGEIENLIGAKVLRYSEDGNLELTFVGIVVFKTTLLFAGPKFDVAGHFSMSEILRILRCYFSRSRSRRPVIDRMTDPEYGNDEVLKEYDALIQLRTWFRDHGIYRREQALTCNQGRPHWVKTIAKCRPVLIQKSVIYPDVIAEKKDGVLSEVSALQIGILGRLLERYGLPDSGGAIKHAEQATGSAVPNWPMPESQRSYFERCVSAEQRRIYRTDMLRLLKLLREVLNTGLAGSESLPQIYGTTAFYAVWEDVCRIALGADNHDGPSASLGKPVWWTSGEGGKVGYEHLQIPDIVVVRDSRYIIADAKYYYPFPKSRPGGPDIVKQLFYAEALHEPGAQARSIFLLPLPSQQSPTFLGYSTIEGASRKFSQIEAWGLDPLSVFSNYPLASTDGANALIDTMLGQWNRVAEFVDQPPTNIGG